MDHIQTKQPFELPARSVTDAGGKTFTGKRARVYWLLALARKKGTRFPIGKGRLSEPGWVPLWVFRETWAGGVQGDRRLRELRTLHRYQVHRKTVEGTGTTVYRIGAPSFLLEKKSRRPNPEQKARPKRSQPLRGLAVSFIEQPSGGPDEVLIEPGHVLWPALGSHYPDGWVEQMRRAWKRRELLAWVGRRELVIVLRPEDADTLLFDLRRSLVEVLRTMGAEVRL